MNKKLNLMREGKMSKTLVTLSLPSIIGVLITSVSMALLNKFSAMYGDSTIAAIGIVSKLCSIPTLAVTGFSRGYQNIVAFNYGANNLDRVKEATKLAIICSPQGGKNRSIFKSWKARYFLYSYTLNL